MGVTFRSTDILKSKHNLGTELLNRLKHIETYLYRPTQLSDWALHNPRITEETNRTISKYFLDNLEKAVNRRQAEALILLEDTVERVESAIDLVKSGYVEFIHVTLFADLT